PLLLGPRALPLGAFSLLLSALSLLLGAFPLLLGAFFFQLGGRWNPSTVAIIPAQPEPFPAQIIAAPQSKPKLDVLDAESPLMILDLFVARSLQRENAQLIVVATEGHVIRHAQPLLVDFPLGRRLIHVAQLPPEVLFRCARREQFDDNQRRFAFLPDQIA